MFLFISDAIRTDHLSEALVSTIVDCLKEVEVEEVVETVLSSRTC